MSGKYKGMLGTMNSCFGGSIRRPDHLNKFASMSRCYDDAAGAEPQVASICWGILDMLMGTASPHRENHKLPARRVCEAASAVFIEIHSCNSPGR